MWVWRLVLGPFHYWSDSS